MKFFLTKHQSTQSRRFIKRFLWWPTQVMQVNDTKEYRWLEWDYFEQIRHKLIASWSSWEDYKRIDKKQYEKYKNLYENTQF